VQPVVQVSRQHPQSVLPERCCTTHQPHKQELPYSRLVPSVHQQQMSQPPHLNMAVEQVAEIQAVREPHKCESWRAWLSTRMLAGCRRMSWEWWSECCLGAVMLLPCQEGPTSCWRMCIMLGDGECKRSAVCVDVDVDATMDECACCICGQRSQAA